MKYHLKGRMNAVNWFEARRQNRRPYNERRALGRRPQGVDILKDEIMSIPICEKCSLMVSDQYIKDKARWNCPGCGHQNEIQSEPRRQATLEKPPLGITPRHIHQQQRMDDIYDACTRFYEAGREIPQEWIEEYVELNGELAKYGARININGFQKKPV